MASKVVFISYSHESEEHRKKVLGLSERLRQDGLETRLDQYVNGTPRQTWPRWMLDQLDEADFVLVICTETYYRRFRGHEELGKGKGADWEGELITQEIYNARSATLKFVPVMLEDGLSEFIPEPLRGLTYYTLISEESYQALYDFLLGQAGVEPGEVGEVKIRPRRAPPPLTLGEPPRVGKPLESHASTSVTGDENEALRHLDVILDDRLSRCHSRLEEFRAELARRLLKPGQFGSSFHQLERIRIYREGIETRKQAFLGVVRDFLPALKAFEPGILLSELNDRADEWLGDYISDLEKKSEHKGKGRGVRLARLDLGRQRVVDAVKAELFILCWHSVPPKPLPQERVNNEHIDQLHEVVGKPHALPRPAIEGQAQQRAPSRLRHGTDHLFGREVELQKLDTAWSDPRTNVVTLVAWGGVGKTALVAKWTAQLAAHDYDGASYFDWSFFSQGTRETDGPSSDTFVAAALTFFGDAEMAKSPVSAWDKGARLAQLVAACRTLLVLDGLEPLQYPPGPLSGQLNDPALQALLKGLAANNPGLCLVTTRARVADLAPSGTPPRRSGSSVVCPRPPVSSCSGPSVSRGRRLSSNSWCKTWTATPSPSTSWASTYREPTAATSTDATA